MNGRLSVAALGIGLIMLPAAEQPAPAKVLRFGQLWNGTRLMQDASVIVSDNKVVAVSAGRTDIPGGAEEIDLRKYTAIPGLIDLHTHMTYYWNRDPATKARQPVTPRRTPAQMAEVSFENALRTLETGVTTVRDLGAGGGADYLMRDAVNAGQKVGPRLFVAGAGLSAPRNATNTIDQWRQLVEARVQAGSDWIKLYGSRGSYESVDTTQILTLEDMKAVVEAGYAAKKRVAIQIDTGFFADIVAIEGEPLKNIEDVIKGVRWVMKDRKVVVDKR